MSTTVDGLEKHFINDFHFDLNQNELDYNATRLFLVKTINKPLEKNWMWDFSEFFFKNNIFCIKTSNKCHFSSFCNRNCFRYFATVDALHGLICGKIVLLRSWKPFPNSLILMISSKLNLRLNCTMICIKMNFIIMQLHYF